MVLISDLFLQNQGEQQSQCNDLERLRNECASEEGGKEGHGPLHTAIVAKLETIQHDKVRRSEGRTDEEQPVDVDKPPRQP